MRHRYTGCLLSMLIPTLMLMKQGRGLLLACLDNICPSLQDSSSYFAEVFVGLLNLSELRRGLIRHYYKYDMKSILENTTTTTTTLLL